RRSAADARLARAPRELPARLLEQLPVGNAGGTHGLARAAVQAVVEVRHERITRRDAALREPAHQVQAPAWRIRLDLERAVGRTRGETQPAVDTGVEVGHRRRIGAVEPTRARGGRGGGNHRGEDIIAPRYNSGDPVARAARSGD